LLTYRPYKKQAEFHAAGTEHDERLFMAGNRLGKTLAGGFEWAMHLTGRYPEWWRGRVFDGPVRMWASGVTGESTGEFRGTCSFRQLPLHHSKWLRKRGF
jgi:hypothetical protein